ncbi:MAG: CvpA family protein [Pseudomonadota bacterium]
MEFTEQYNVIDIFIIAVLGLTVILGVWKGFVRSLTAMAGLAAGIILAVRYYPKVEPHLSKVSSLDSHISIIISMVLIFILVQAIFVLIRMALAAILDFTRLTWLDRVLGAAMGAAGGWVVVAAAVQGLLLGIPEWPDVKKSRLIRPVEQLTARMMQQAPQGLKNHMQSLNEKWNGLKEKPGAKPNPKASVYQGPSGGPPLKTATERADRL